MDHDRMKDMISALLDGELEGPDKTKAQTHLDSCESCRAFSENWKSLSRELFRPRPVEFSGAFTQGVMDRIETAEKKRTSFRIIPVRWLAPAVGIAVAVLFALLPAEEGLTYDALLGETDITQTQDVLTFVLEGK